MRTRAANGSKLAGRPIVEILKPVEPWPDPVDGAAWLEECEAELRPAELFGGPIRRPPRTAK